MPHAHSPHYYMSIVTIEGEKLKRPRLASTVVAADAIGSLASVVIKKGASAEDWSYEMGVYAYVFRTGDPTNRIHVAYEEAELENISDTVPSGRSSAVHEIGVIGMSSVPVTDEAGNRKKYNMFFCVTDASGARAADIVFIELYDRNV